MKIAFLHSIPRQNYWTILQNITEANVGALGSMCLMLTADAKAVCYCLKCFSKHSPNTIYHHHSLSKEIANSEFFLHNKDRTEKGINKTIQKLGTPLKIARCLTNREPLNFKRVSKEQNDDNSAGC